MKPTLLHVSHHDHILELELQLDARLADLLDLARDKGWHQSAIAAALTSLAGNYAKKLEENLQTDIDIARAMRRIDRHRH